ncbi:hypothetical protein Ddc_18408 [Ditylenchus destructor]|nr:hypothetical protein Ddc_18408 [Ditylenchus destructor]
MFPVTNWGPTNKKGKEAIFLSQSNPGVSYRFVSDGNRNRYYCGNCFSVDKTKVRVVIKDDNYSHFTKHFQSMQKELYRHSVESERIMKGQPIRLRKRKYREAEVKFAQIRQEYRAVVEGNVSCFGLTSLIPD